MSTELHTPSRKALTTRLKTQRVGIDVQESTIRIVCVGRTGNRWSWLSRSEVNLVTESSSFDRGTQSRNGGRSGTTGGVNASNLAGAVAASLPATIDAQPRKSSLVLPMSVSLIRTPISQDAEVVERELKEDLGGIVGRGDSLLACSWVPVTQGIPAGLNMNRKEIGCIYATSEQLSIAVASAVQSCGYELPEIAPRPHVLARSVNLTSHPYAYGILEWGVKYCTLVLRNRWDSSSFDSPGHTRQLHGFSLYAFLGEGHQGHGDGGSESSIASSQDEMSRERRQRGLVNCVQGLASEIIRTLQAVRFEVPAGTPPLLLVCGDAVSIAGACESLQKAIGHSVSPWRWCGSERPTTHFASPEDARFAVALGAACGGDF